MSWSGPRVTALRAQWARLLPLPCWRCGQVINRTDPWDVGHIVDLALGGDPWDPNNQAPEHTGCNRAAGARLGNHLRTRHHRRLG